jgi:molecular chaperone DnaJ
MRCRDCQGNGKTGTKKCENCHFTGNIKDNTELSIKLPAGLKDNSILRLQGAGHQFREFAGDLLLKVKIVSYGKYYLLNDELCINIEAPLSTFISGGDIEITDLENDVIIVKILPQTPSGTKLRVKNKGMLLPNSESRSDLIAIINVEVPNITDINMLVQLKNLGI